MHRLACLLFTAVTVLHGCGASRSPVSQGHTGFLSDRAFELEASVRARAPLPPPGAPRPLPAPMPPAGDGSEAQRVALADLRERAWALEAAGTPLFFERASVQIEATEGPTDVAYSAQISNLVRRSDAAPEAAYRDAPGLHFRWPPPATTLASPRYGELAGDGVLRVSAVFGQMRPDDPLDKDEGRWSRDTFVGGLEREGYALADDPQRPGERVWLRPGPLRVEVEVHGPEEIAVEGHDEQAASALRGALGRAEVFYLNGHTLLPSFRPLVEAASYQPARHRLLVLDLCWSYFDYARAVLDAAPDAQVVSTDGRVVTGSVGSFASLLGGLIEGAEALHSDREPARWLPLLTRMNDLAQQRSDQRRGQVEARLSPPEVYGVSPVW